VESYRSILEACGPLAPPGLLTKLVPPFLPGCEASVFLRCHEDDLCYGTATICCPQNAKKCTKNCKSFPEPGVVNCNKFRRDIPAFPKKLRDITNVGAPKYL
jgi:hypothetical protein